ncbi:hypothetical protein F0562_020238 [Nyssa sinensis]|uniref:Uncharacterized protein n=1 Tax=Nyssa sinensis TaxID=561372 RepID=A0A5J5BRX7_9ASTE|nr:hypothetical protein F0562_020238 [Nyssa sinensis]
MKLQIMRHETEYVRASKFSLDSLQELTKRKVSETSINRSLLYTIIFAAIISQSSRCSQEVGATCQGCSIGSCNFRSNKYTPGIALSDSPIKLQKISVQNLTPRELLALSVQLLAKGHKDRAIPLLRFPSSPKASKRSKSEATPAKGSLTFGKLSPP